MPPPDQEDTLVNSTALLSVVMQGDGFDGFGTGSVAACNILIWWGRRDENIIDSHGPS